MNKFFAKKSNWVLVGCCAVLLAAFIILAVLLFRMPQEEPVNTQSVESVSMASEGGQESSGTAQEEQSSEPLPSSPNSSKKASSRAASSKKTAASKAAASTSKLVSSRKSSSPASSGAGSKPSVSSQAGSEPSYTIGNVKKIVLHDQYEGMDYTLKNAEAQKFMQYYNAMTLSYVLEEARAHSAAGKLYAEIVYNDHTDVLTFGDYLKINRKVYRAVSGGKTFGDYVRSFPVYTESDGKNAFDVWDIGFGKTNSEPSYLKNVKNIVYGNDGEEYTLYPDEMEEFMKRYSDMRLTVAGTASQSIDKEVYAKIVYKDKTDTLYLLGNIQKNGIQYKATTGAADFMNYLGRQSIFRDKEYGTVFKRYGLLFGRQDGVLSIKLAYDGTTRYLTEAEASQFMKLFRNLSLVPGVSNVSGGNVMVTMRATDGEKPFSLPDWTLNGTAYQAKGGGEAMLNYINQLTGLSLSN